MIHEGVIKIQLEEHTIEFSLLDLSAGEKSKDRSSYSLTQTPCSVQCELLTALTK